jgi:predicted DCC family thiol-disulfide oxidoreductase YuxK
MIFDGDCRFCRHWIERWRHITGDRVEYLPLQDQSLSARFPELARDQLERSVHLIEPDGRVYQGAEAVFRSQLCARQWPAWAYEKIPGVAQSTEFVYAFIAAHRSFFSLLTRWLVGTNLEPSTHFLVRWLFLRSLGLVYLIAFVSLGSQIRGLSGSNGIVPAKDVLRAYEQNLPNADRFIAAPTICWLSAEDGFLRWMCIGGAMLAAALFAGAAPLPCLALLWMLYLSLSVVCTPFLGFQWDALLLEAGFLAIFLAPLRLLPNLARESPPSRLALLLLRCLLFKLMFASGVVKLASGDAAWHGLTALTVHYETQPLPTWIGWYVHQLPVAAHKILCVAMFAIELVVPFLIFLQRRPRFVAFWLFVTLQLVIALTGNYTFFNLLTAVLCVPLLDDHALTRFARKRIESSQTLRPRRTGALRIIGLSALGLAAIVWLSVSTVELLGAFHYRWSPASPLVRLYRTVAPFRSINGYGLFAVMTMARPEIIVEGSNDGVTWLPYEFKYKPGDPTRPPRFVAPHQPRLDWQMWFAALGEVRQNPWFVNFCLRLLEGKREVLALMKTNPFPDKPPKYIRASLYDYRFTNFQQRRVNGSWWRREYKGEYLPAISLNRDAR